LLEPYLKDTNIGLPYWDWTKNSKVPDLWENIPSPIKDWKEKRTSDFRRFGSLDIQSWRNRCKSPTSDIGAHSLRNNNLNVLRNSFQQIVDDTKNAMEADDLDSFRSDIEVKLLQNIQSCSKLYIRLVNRLL